MSNETHHSNRKAETAPGDGPDQATASLRARLHAAELETKSIVDAQGATRTVMRLRRYYSVRRALRDTQYGRIVALDRLRPSGEGHGLLATGKVYAAKVYNRAFVDSHFGQLSGSTIQEDALTELRLWLALSRAPHPNVSRLADIGVDAKSVVAVTDLAESDAFDYCASQNFRVPLATSRCLLRQLVQGVAHLHRHGVAHRDLSLENATIHAGSPDRLPVLKVIDFGLAANVGQHPATRPAVPTQRSGKCGYMAPEVFAGAPTHDPFASDVWAVGVAALVLLCGTQPWQAPVTSRQCRKMDAATLASVKSVVGMPADSELRSVVGGMDYVAEGRVDELMRGLGAHPKAVDAAADLVGAMLHIDPTQRPTADVLLAHPFLADAPQPALVQRALAQAEGAVQAPAQRHGPGNGHGPGTGHGPENGQGHDPTARGACAGRVRVTTAATMRDTAGGDDAAAQSRSRIACTGAAVVQARSVTPPSAVAQDASPSSRQQVFFPAHRRASGPAGDRKRTRARGACSGSAAALPAER